MIHQEQLQRGLAILSRQRDLEKESTMGLHRPQGVMTWEVVEMAHGPLCGV